GHGAQMLPGHLPVRRLRPVDDELARAQALVAEFDEALRQELPADAEIFDAHVHLGKDIDGMRGEYDELVRFMDRYGISRCFMFCLDEPDRHPAFRAAIDLLSVFRVFSPEQIVYASDFPYGQQPSSLLIALRTARVSGLDEQDVRNMLAHTANRIADGEAPLEPTPPKGGDTFSQPMAFARIHQYLSMATPLLWTRQPDTVGVIGLALNACYDRDGHADERERIRELLAAARDVWRLLPEVDEPDQRIISRTTFRLIHLADILAVTPSSNG